jgi:hypothetical protein
VLARIDGALVLNFAYIYMVAQNLVWGTPGEAGPSGHSPARLRSRPAEDALAVKVVFEGRHAPEPQVIREDGANGFCFLKGFAIIRDESLMKSTVFWDLSIFRARRASTIQKIWEHGHREGQDGV